MLIQGDARRLPLQDETAQCCVTSPPYWGLRDYGHVGQIGLEETPEAYVAALVEVFREVRRVLKPDGVLWCNLGDSFANDCFGQGGESLKQRGNRGTQHALSESDRYRGIPEGLKRKDLVGIPWMVAFALRADGWFLRADCIWDKPNCMPESVRDRPTRSHEYLFLLTKSAQYYYDADAVREAHSAESLARVGRGHHRAGHNWEEGPGSQTIANDLSQACHPLGRNRRTVWRIPTRSYRGAHFAVYPEALVEPCILSGSRPGDVVLDPFCGSGTTVAVAERLGRKGVGVEAKADYLTLARKRCVLPQPALALSA